MSKLASMVLEDAGGYHS